MKRTLKKSLAVILTLLLMISTTTMVFAAPTPPNQSDAGILGEKYDKNDQVIPNSVKFENGKITGSIPAGFTITPTYTDGGTKLSWSVVGNGYAISKVSVKASSGGYLYDYKDKNITSDSGLIGSFNHKGDLQKISHVTFHYYPIPTYTVTTTANPAAGGTVTGAGSYAAGSTATVSYTANPGYRFVRWDGTKPSDTIVGNTISFVMNSNRAVTAVFELIPAPVHYTVTATANPAAGGTVTGAGTYEAGATATLSYEVNPDYQFVRWDGTEGTDTIVDNTISFVVNGNRALTAVFELIPEETPVTYTVTAIASPAAGGTVTGAGSYAAGATATVSYTANAGYRFVRWDGTVEGDTIAGNTISFIMNGNRDVTAVFEVIPVVTPEEPDDETPVTTPNTVDIIPEETPAAPIATTTAITPAAPIDEPVAEIVPEETPAGPVVSTLDTGDMDTVDLSLEATPAGPAKLPKTGGMPSEVLYGFGALVTLLGVTLKKRA